MHQMEGQDRRYIKCFLPQDSVSSRSIAFVATSLMKKNGLLLHRQMTPRSHIIFLCGANGPQVG